MTEEEKQEALRKGRLMPTGRCVSKVAVGRGLMNVPSGIGKSSYYQTAAAGVDIPPVKIIEEK